MFKSQKIRGKGLSTKNLVLVFLTIVLGFASVITLANIEITPTTNDTWQTISKTTITSAGSETEKVIELSSTGMYINNNILTEKTQFSGKVLGIDENGNIIYTYSDNFTGDNLGNHTATKNLKMGMHFISYSGGDNKGIGFDIDDNLHTAQKIKTQQTLQIAQDGETTCSTTNAGEIRFINECFQGCDGFSRNNIVGEGCNGIITTACLGTLPTYATSTSIGSIPINTSWNYNQTPGSCTFVCTGGYIYSGTINECVFDGQLLLGSSNSYGRGQGIFINQDTNDIYLGVNFSDTISFGDITVAGGGSSNNGQAIFSLKNNILTGKNIQITGTIFDVVSDQSGNVYVNDMNLTLGKHLIIKNDDHLNRSYQKELAGQYMTYGGNKSMVMHENGYLYVIGLTKIYKIDRNNGDIILSGNIGFYVGGVSTLLTQDNVGDLIAVYRDGPTTQKLVKYNPINLSIKREKEIGYSGMNEDITTDDNGDIYIYQDNFITPFSHKHIRKFKKLGGDLIREKDFSYLTQGLGGENLGSISSYDNYIYACFNFSNSLLIENQTFTSSGGLDFLVLKMDIQGNVLGTQKGGSSGNEYCKEIEYDNQGNIYVLGGMQSATTGYRGPYVFPIYNGYRIFFFKIPSGYNF